jgi:BMFP domain-containing protein YqiC
MKKLMLKLLGLESLVTAILTLRKENEELKKSLADLETKVDEIEIPDADDFVREDDVNDRIESYLNDNDYCSSSYVDDEIESKVSEKVEEAIEEKDFDEIISDKVEEAMKTVDAELEDKVKEVVADMDKASFGDTEEIESAVSKAVAEVLSKAYNALKKGL